MRGQGKEGKQGNWKGGNADDVFNLPFPVASIFVMAMVFGRFGRLVV